MILSNNSFQTLSNYFPLLSFLQTNRIVVSPSTSPITGIKAELIAAANNAAEIAIRLVKPGGKNWEVTEGIKKVLAEYESVGVKGVEGVLSHQVSLMFRFCAWERVDGLGERKKKREKREEVVLVIVIDF